VFILPSGTKKIRQKKCHQTKKWSFGHYFAVDLVIILPQFGKHTLPHLHVNVAVYFAQILKFLPE